MDPIDQFIKDRLRGKFYQICTLILLSLVNLINGGFFILTSIAGPEIKHDYSLTDDEVSFMASTYQIGIVVGAVLGAEIAKLFGRSAAIKISSVVQLIAALGIFYCFSYKVVCILFAFYGIFNGVSLNVLSTYASEIAPIETRGRWMIFLNSFLTLGKVGGSVLARFYLQKGIPGSWKMLFVYSTFIYAFIIPFVLVFLKESLRYLAVNKRFKEFKSTFNLIARINNIFARQDSKSLLVSTSEVTLLSETLERQQSGQPKGSYGLLCSKKFIKINLLTGAMWIAAYVTINGQSAILPFWFNSASGLNSVVMTLSGEIPAVLLGFWLIDRPTFGRKRSLQFVTFLTTVCLFASYFIVNDFVMTIMFTFTRFSIKGIFLFLFPYTSELYPTVLRTLGLGYGNGIGGFASCVLPFVLFPLYHLNRYNVFLLMGAFAFIGFLGSIQLSVDTTNKSLDQADSDTKKDSKEEYLVEDEKAVTKCSA